MGTWTYATWFILLNWKLYKVLNNDNQHLPVGLNNEIVHNRFQTNKLLMIGRWKDGCFWMVFDYQIRDLFSPDQLKFNWFDVCWG